MGKNVRALRFLCSSWLCRSIAHLLASPNRAVALSQITFFGSHVCLLLMVSHSRSQNCWDVFVSSPPLNVGVDDLPTESQ